MALIQDQMQKTDAARLPQAPAPNQAQEGNVASPQEQSPDGEAASPQEQQNYEKVVLAGMRVIQDPSTHQHIMQMLQSGKDDPAKALADVTTMIMTQLDEKSGGQIPPEVILPAAAEILSLTAEVAEAAGVFPMDERVLGAATQHLVMGIAEKYGVDPDEMQSLISGVDKRQLQGMVEQQRGFAQGSQRPAAGAPVTPTQA